MTKAKMIQIMQQQEAAAFLQLKTTECEYGSDHRFTAQDRNRWSGLYNAMQAMGINSDNTLPDNQAATALILRRLQHKEAECA